MGLRRNYVIQYFKFEIFFFVNLQTMDSFLHLIIALLLVASGIYGRAIDDLDNSIQSVDETKDFKLDFLTISAPPPPKVIQPLGTTIELECEVSGVPPPTIQWVRGSNPDNSVSVSIFFANFFFFSLFLI